MGARDNRSGYKFATDSLTVTQPLHAKTLEAEALQKLVPCCWSCQDGLARLPFTSIRRLQSEERQSVPAAFDGVLEGHLMPRHQPFTCLRLAAFLDSATAASLGINEPKTTLGGGLKPLASGGGIFKSAAVAVLRLERKLMTTGDITKVALEKELINCQGKTPDATNGQCTLH
ncbi:hypothetical protein WJX84_000262 [Apatococcus fuscideae]|uniref:HTH HARE-type domain-containing protein n=1 Tax=Apatococcus fuscideae TaxID=2026836 RepID=A0AAW1TA79_9CHLO